MQGSEPETPPARATASDPFDEIVVTAPTGGPAKLDPIASVERMCFDPNRLTGQSQPPEDDPDWTPPVEKTRGQFGIADPAVPASGLVDAARAQTLLIRFETLQPKAGLRENRCTLVVTGG